MMSNKCPKCQNSLHRAVINDISLDVPGGKTWRGLAYVCPDCDTILSVQMDPIALKSDTIEGIASRIRRG